MLKAIVNNNKSFEVREEDGQLNLNGSSFDWDVSEQGESFHIIHHFKSYNAELISSDFVSKKFKIKINGKLYDIDIKDKLDLLLEKLGIAQTVSTAVRHITAPMPGLILQIHVQEGSEVKKGDPIMVLEAMKMENTLKSPGEGIVKSIMARVGESVEKNQVLIDFKNNI